MIAYDSLSSYDSFWLPSGLSSSQGLRRACFCHIRLPQNVAYLTCIRFDPAYCTSAPEPIFSIKVDQIIKNIFWLLPSHHIPYYYTVDHEKESVSFLVSYSECQQSKGWAMWSRMGSDMFMRGYRDSETRAPGSRPLTRRHGPSQWRREQGRQSNNNGAQVMGQVEKGNIYLVLQRPLFICDWRYF